MLHSAIELRPSRAIRDLVAELAGMASLAIVTVLAGRSGEVFADHLNHVSLNDAMILSRARCRRYAHCDMAALESFLARSAAADKVVVTDCGGGTVAAGAPCRIVGADLPQVRIAQVAIASVADSDPAFDRG